MTSNSTSNGQQLELANTTNYESQLLQKQSREVTGQKFIDLWNTFDTGHKGAINEHVVAVEAMRRGAKVFRNLSPTGDTDIVLVKDDKFIRVDVKHMSYDPRWNGTWQPNNHTVPPPNVSFAYVHPITLKVHWSKQRTPKDWEDFWD